MNAAVKLIRAAMVLCVVIAVLGVAVAILAPLIE